MIEAAVAPDVRLAVAGSTFGGLAEVAACAALFAVGLLPSRSTCARDFKSRLLLPW